MKIFYTEQSLESLQELLDFLSEQVNSQKLVKIRDKIVESIDSLLKNPKLGQPEEYLEHLGLGHRRIIVGHCKIIYRIDKETIYITDVFDSRQDPLKMKG